MGRRIARLGWSASISLVAFSMVFSISYSGPVGETLQKSAPISYLAFL